jgi:LPXTG-motif cell wall-anchored protein
MRHRIGFAVLAIVAVAAAVSAQTTTKSSETKRFEVVSVDGNKIVVKGAEGAKEITVGSDFHMTVDGKPITAADLKPGMKGTATITTTTTVTPVTVTEVKNGEVVQANGGSVLVRTANGFKSFTEGDMTKRNVTIIKDGQKVGIADLHAGDRLSATIVTEKPPKTMTQRQVTAALNGVAPAPGTTASAPARPSSHPATAPAPAAAAHAAPAKKLPKTATSDPFVALVGALSLALATGLTFLRKRGSF